MNKLKSYHRPDVKRWIRECFDKFSNLYFKGWITTREIQDYILQTYGVFIKTGTIANIIYYNMYGITRTKIGYIKQYNIIKKIHGSSFIKNVLKMNPNLTIYRLNGDNIKYD